ncbi:MAG: hypothetical protein ACHQE6_04045 [Solirubrobacterales bacterium]
MKRIVLALVVPAMLLSAPGIALAAHHGHGRHAAHHARRHAGRARHARLVRFGDPTAPAGPGSGTPPAGTGAAPTGATPTTPTPAGEPAGKVLTFENGVLSIELNGGTKVSGQVTESTRLICLPATPPPTSTGGDDQGGGDDGSGVQSGEHGGPASQPSSGGWSGEDNQQGQQGAGDEQDMDSEDDGQQQSCETSALTAGAVVREAELSLSGSGAVWERIVLVH